MFYFKILALSLIFYAKALRGLILSIALGTAVCAAFLNIYLDLDSKLKSQLQAFGANFSIKGPLSLAQYEEALSLIDAKALKAASPFKWSLLSANGKSTLLLGASLDALPRLDIVYKRLKDAKLFAGRNLDLKGRVKIFNESKQTSLELELGGFYESGDERDSALLMDIKDLQELLGDESIDYAELLVELDYQALQELSQKFAQNGVRAAPKAAISLSEAALLQKLSLLLALIGLVILLLSFIATNSTLGLILRARGRESALLLSLGAGVRDLYALFLGFALCASLLASLLGLLLALPLSSLLASSVFAAKIDHKMQAFLLALLISLLCSLAASLKPIARAFKKSLSSNLRQE